MWYNLLTSIGARTVSTVTINVTYIDDDSNVVGVDVSLDNAATLEPFSIEATSSDGVAIFSNVPNGTYNVTVASVVLDTIYVRLDSYRSYSIERDTTVLNGLLYNGYAVDTGNIAPTGWHIPSSVEFNTLLSNWSTDSERIAALVDGGSSGFNAKFSGSRSSVTGIFESLGTSTVFVDSGTSITLTITSSAISIASLLSNKQGYSIRMVKDNPLDWSEGDIVTDLDGNIYNTVKIGSQIWTVQNWACTQYNDGTPISNVRLSSDWTGLTTGAYCSYENNSDNIFINYTDSNILNGRLYNGYAVLGLAPYPDLSIPTDTEWNTLESYISSLDSGQEAEVLKAMFGWDTGYEGTDKYHFSAVGAGVRGPTGNFNSIETGTFFWTSTDSGVGVYSRQFNIADTIGRINSDKNNGYSIRMIVNLSSDFAVNGGTYNDDEGNTYDIRKIGTQYWLVQNWASSLDGAGSPISEITDNSTWAADTTGAMCAYNNDNSYIYK